MKVTEGKRWSGFEWSDQQKEILLIGAGGIGSWLALSLSRIMHDLTIVDGDVIDVTNVEGGQLYTRNSIGSFKVGEIMNICRLFGCTNSITTIADMYTPDMGMFDICITGLDNMKARKEIFTEWEKHISIRDFEERETCLFIDGRMGGELREFFVLQGNKQEQINEYKTKWLFDDSDVAELDCTRKQTTFVAMGIASEITSVFCNWLANKKIGMELNDVPFHSRFYSPLMELKTEEVEILLPEII